MSIRAGELKAISILDVADRLGLKRRGVWMRCINPAHADSKPSLHFVVKGNYFYCFGCPLHGSTIELVMAASGCSREDAMRWLAEEFGFSHGSARPLHLRLHVQRREGQAPSKGQRPAPERRPDPEIYDWLLRQAQLPREAKEYLLGRKLSPRTISDFRLGGSLDARSLILATEKQFGRDRAFRAGLLTENGGLGKLRPVWWEPIVLIPFYWKESAPIYLQARRLTAEDRRKYVGLSGVAKPLFNAQIVHELKAGAEIYVVEGAMDAMAAHEVGLQAIGVLGAMTEFKRSWALALRDFQITIVPDQDRAGIRFKNRVASAFEDIGKSIQVRYLPVRYKDLTDALGAIKAGKL